VTATSAAQAMDDRYVVEYYYKIRWGYQEEFLRLFRKNHYPVLARQIETGRILEVTAVAPRLHATEDGRWDYRVTIAFRDVAATIGPSLGEAEMRALFPDKEAFEQEERRRFEILEAHWDVPIKAVALT
jgi:hypothetical protein